MLGDRIAFLNSIILVMWVYRAGVREPKETGSWMVGDREVQCEKGDLIVWCLVYVHGDIGGWF